VDVMKSKCLEICFFLIDDQQTDPASGSNLNKSKGDKKQKSTTTDDTKQPGK
jgi:hypothetical protein